VPTLLLSISPLQLPPADAHQLRPRLFCSSESGEDQIVLISDPIDESASTTKDGALKPSPRRRWQVLSIQLHWRTSSSPKTDALVATSGAALVRVRQTHRTGVGVLHYLGTGSVSISSNSSGANIDITQADLKFCRPPGRIRDPFQAFSIRAHVHAENNPGQVRQCLADIQKAIDASKPGAAVQTGTSPRFKADGNNLQRKPVGMLCQHLNFRRR